MKKLFSAIIIATLLQSEVYAQPSPAPDKEEGASGQIVLPDNSIVTGTVKNNIRKKGEVLVLNGDKKTKYKAGDITSVQIGNIHYITRNYTFYEILFQGKNLTLLRKANEPSGLQYNGSDAIVVNSEGNVDDLFIRKTGDKNLQLITKKNVKEELVKVCSSCAASFDTSSFDADTVKKAVESCDSCK